MLSGRNYTFFLLLKNCLRFFQKKILFMDKIFIVLLEVVKREFYNYRLVAKLVECHTNQCALSLSLSLTHTPLTRE